MRRRETYNFAAEEAPINAKELDSAVATANLISIMDPKELGDEEVKLISEATGASEGFVDEMADVCNDACEECAAGKPVEEAKSNFSAAVNQVITKYVESANFSAPEAQEPTSAEEQVLQVAQLTALVDDEILKDSPKEVAETISKATEVPVEVVEPVVENAKEQFSNGNVMYLEAEDVANFCNYCQQNFWHIPGADAVADAVGVGKGGETIHKLVGNTTKTGNLKFYGDDLGEKGKAAAKATWKGLKATGSAIAQGAKTMGHDIDMIAATAVPGGRIVAYGVPAAAALATGAIVASKKKAAKKNFSEGEEEVAEVVAPVVEQTIVPEPTTLPAEGALKEGVEDTKPAAGTAQDPVKEALMDPKEGGKVQDTAAAETALKVQQDLATVESVADVTPAQTNFGRQNLTGKEVTEGLKGLLGARYIPNK